jgi:hypothetical protein
LRNNRKYYAHVNKLHVDVESTDRTADLIEAIFPLRNVIQTLEIDLLLKHMNNPSDILDQVDFTPFTQLTTILIPRLKCFPFLVNHMLVCVPTLTHLNVMCHDADLLTDLRGNSLTSIEWNYDKNETINNNFRAENFSKLTNLSLSGTHHILEVAFLALEKLKQLKSLKLDVNLIDVSHFRDPLLHITTLFVKSSYIHQKTSFEQLFPNATLYFSL